MNKKKNVYNLFFLMTKVQLEQIKEVVVYGNHVLFLHSDELLLVLVVHHVMCIN